MQVPKVTLRDEMMVRGNPVAVYTDDPFSDTSVYAQTPNPIKTRSSFRGEASTRMYVLYMQ